ncbi:DNA/RNA nuclease SfsA [Clostridium thailandense]|uniref:DNA/RNA nuclease SfsA n=1 Tax=Clostridium thailandense TaxID=2794346 RepID=UPI00398A4E03
MEIKNNAFIFETPLIEGVIRKRKNRFIMEVEIDGEICDCHCPTTGSIGNIVLQDIPCLLSKSRDTARKTLYTVEAISLDLPSENNKSWIGINQNAANRYVEHFLKTGQFSAMVEKGDTVKREQKLGNSKLDFLVDNIYIEVKTPLQCLQVPIGEHIKTKKVTELNSTDRFVRHINELAESLKENERAILITCFIYDNPGFKPVGSKRKEYVREQVESCLERGLETWQVNLRITPTELSIIKYFKTSKN